MAKTRIGMGQEALAVIAPELINFIRSVSAIERCSALAVSNALLLKSASHWGREITHQPMKIKPEKITAVLDALHDQYVRLEAAFDNTDGSNMHDIYVMACKWEMVATQVVMVTVGASLSREYANVANQAWKHLAKSRHVAQLAVNSLLEYGKFYKDSPVPLLPGKQPTKHYLFALATNLPPMFSVTKKVQQK